MGSTGAGRNDEVELERDEDTELRCRVGADGRELVGISRRAGAHGHPRNAPP